MQKTLDFDGFQICETNQRVLADLTRFKQVNLSRLVQLEIENNFRKFKISLTTYEPSLIGSR